MIKIVICGVCGRMGKRIATLASRDKDISIVGATETKGCSFTGVNLGEELKTHNLGVAISDDLNESIKKCDCVIDFTAPGATLNNLKIARINKKPIVIGTTGFTKESLKEIESASRDIPILFSPNMSVAVNLVFDLVKKTAKTLGEAYSVKMEEVHHIHKKDKPSGTGKLLAEMIKKEREDLKDIPINSIREGEVVGDHKIIFDSEEDTIEITHKAKTRDIFAFGAIQAAKFLVGKPKGLYSMKDVLEL